ncbi:unannotated protein [freshwater metagenome]|uniref:Unannotated protein n=1 Tax=freshwater metagenome TaxID=449393 RepID=A0A6J7MGE0_9ZZZZ
MTGRNGDLQHRDHQHVVGTVVQVHDLTLRVGRPIHRPQRGTNMRRVVRSHLELHQRGQSTRRLQASERQLQRCSRAEPPNLGQRPSIDPIRHPVTVVVVVEEVGCAITIGVDPPLHSVGEAIDIAVGHGRITEPAHRCTRVRRTGHGEPIDLDLVINTITVRVRLRRIGTDPFLHEVGQTIKVGVGSRVSRITQLRQHRQPIHMRIRGLAALIGTRLRSQILGLRGHDRRGRHPRHSRPGLRLCLRRRGGHFRADQPERDHDRHHPAHRQRRSRRPLTHRQRGHQQHERGQQQQLGQMIARQIELPPRHTRRVRHTRHRRRPILRELDRDLTRRRHPRTHREHQRQRLPHRQTILTNPQHTRTRHTLKRTRPRTSRRKRRPIHRERILRHQRTSNRVRTSDRHLTRRPQHTHEIRTRRQRIRHRRRLHPPTTSITLERHTINHPNRQRLTARGARASRRQLQLHRRRTHIGHTIQVHTLRLTRTTRVQHRPGRRRHLHHITREVIRTLSTRTIPRRHHRIRPRRANRPLRERRPTTPSSNNSQN